MKFQAKILTGCPVSILGRNPLASLIISHDRPEMNSSDGSDSFDESEVNRNRAQHVKNQGPGLFDLIRQRKQRQIAIKDSGNDGQVSHQQKCDDRLVEPEIVAALAEKSSLPDAADRVLPVNQPQDKSFEIIGDNGSNKHSSEQKKAENLAIAKSLNNSKIPVPFPSSSDETDSEKNELLKQATTSGHSKTNLQNSTENSIRQNPKDNTGDSSKKPTESATVIGSSSSSDSDFNKTPKSSPKQNKTPARQHDQTPSKPANESLTKKKLMSDNCRNSADTNSESGSENEKFPVGESKMTSAKQVQNSGRKKNSPKRKNKDSESEEDEEESTSSAKLLARTAARKGTHDPTRTTAIIRSKISGKNETTHSSSDCSSSDSENEKKSTSLNSSRKLPQPKSQLTSNQVDSSDSSSEEVDVSKPNLQEKTTRGITSKPPPTENKSISKMKEASEDSSSSDDEMFKMIKAKRQNSRAGSVHGSIQSVKHVSSDSDTDSDQFR